MVPMAISKVCIVILNWAGWSDTLECLESLTQLEGKSFTIVVVDNGSADQSVHHILAWTENRFADVPVLQSDKDLSRKFVVSPPFVLICNPSNLGFSGGNNSAITWGLAQECYDYFWLLNNDTTVDPDTLNAEADHLNRCTDSLIGSTVVDAARPEFLQCGGGCFYNPFTTRFRPNLAGETHAAAMKNSKQVSLDYIFGASLFVRTEVFKKCGLLHDEYFLFYEEMDLCKRARKKGFSLHWCKQALVLHKGSSSIGKPDSGERRKIAFANYHENLSTLLFTRRFYPLLLPLAMTVRFFGKLAVIALRANWYLARPLFAAYFDFFAGKNRRESGAGV